MCRRLENIAIFLNDVEAVLLIYHRPNVNLLLNVNGNFGKSLGFADFFVGKLPINQTVYIIFKYIVGYFVGCGCIAYENIWKYIRIMNFEALNWAVILWTSAILFRFGADFYPLLWGQIFYFIFFLYSKDVFK